MLSLGRRLSNSDLLTLSKERDSHTRTRHGRKVTVTLDHVDGLGEYNGSYMEVEIIVTNRADINSAREEIQSLVKEILGEDREPWQHSYLEMLKRSKAAH